MTRYSLLTNGASGYFSRPQVILDPQLFEGDTLLPHVRQTILDNYLDFMSSRFVDPGSWSMAWLAGSGVSYQWASDRGNGDLDVLLGIDYDKFVSANPEYAYYDRYDISDSLTMLMKNELWPITATTIFTPGEHSYEVTYFINPYVEAFDDSINNIIPYAAYNLTADHWTTRPIDLPENPESLYPVEFVQQATENRELAEKLVRRHRYLKAQMSGAMPGSPQMRNYETSMGLLKSEIRSMFDTIHLGRKNAFGPGGTGYGDFYNYQWQTAKRDGIVSTFNEILNEE